MTLPLLHGRPAPTGWLHSDWTPEWPVVIAVIAMAAAYIVFTGSRNRLPDGTQRHPVRTGQRVTFLAGCIVLLISLSPPLDDWSDFYLLSAHMVQHLLLMFAAIPLLMVGTPGWLAERLVSPRLLGTVLRAATRPIPALVLGNAIIAIWHMPFAYNAALKHVPYHIGEHLSFMLAALLMWWPVIGPVPSWPKPAPLLQCLYIFLGSLPGGIVGAFITLAEPGLYQPYDTAPRIFGISLEVDQQIAGLMMWVLTSVIYLIWITVIFLSWASREEAKDRAGSAAAPVAPAVGSR